MNPEYWPFPIDNKVSRPASTVWVILVQPSWLLWHSGNSKQMGICQLKQHIDLVESVEPVQNQNVFPISKNMTLDEPMLRLQPHIGMTMSRCSFFLLKLDECLPSGSTQQFQNTWHSWYTYPILDNLCSYHRK
jgi:hypothetical protein